MTDNPRTTGAEAIVYHGVVRVASFVWTRDGGLVEEMLDDIGHDVIAVEPRRFVDEGIV